MRKILPALILAFLTACSPKVRTELIENTTIRPTNSITSVSIIDIDQPLPPIVEKLGKVRIFDGGLTVNCNWNDVLEKAQLEAMNAGGNLLKITKHILPNAMSTCHQIEADIYYVGNVQNQSEPVIAKSETASVPELTASNQKLNPVSAVYQKYRIAFSGGFSYLLGKTSNSVPPQFAQYVQELKSGSHISLDGGYFWGENAGLGLKYSSFFSKNEMNSGQNNFGKISDNINTQFIGPVLYYRSYNSTRKIIWFANPSLGYISYRNNSLAPSSTKITGSTLGGGLDLGADFKLNENLYFGLGAGYTVGVLKQLKSKSGNSEQTITLEKGNYEGMNRHDLSVGLRLAW